MEIISVNKELKPHAILVDGSTHSSKDLKKPTTKKLHSVNPFIEANTKNVFLSELKENSIIPVFAKDNEKTIAHQEFIEITQDCINTAFHHQQKSIPEIRVSHEIKGRIPDAIHKSAKDLLEHEKTQYYERMAFVIRIPSITETINGNNLSLMVGGVRSYNNENLYGKKTHEKFKFFIGFQNMVCCNLCISTDGFSSEMKVTSNEELHINILEVIQNYEAENHLRMMKELTQQSLTEHQFAQLIGKARLYNFLPKEQKSGLPLMEIADRQMNIIAKDYYEDKSFCKDEKGNINLWNVYNLFTSANKSSYIDSFLDRNVNAFEFSNGLAKTLNGDSKYSWFLN